MSSTNMEDENNTGELRKQYLVLIHQKKREKGVPQIFFNNRCIARRYISNIHTTITTDCKRIYKTNQGLTIM